MIEETCPENFSFTPDKLVDLEPEKVSKKECKDMGFQPTLFFEMKVEGKEEG